MISCVWMVGKTLPLKGKIRILLEGRPLTKIKYVDCLKFGAFDPITGDRRLSSYNNCGLRTHLPLWDETGACWHGKLVNCVVGGTPWHRVAAYIGECIAMVNCNNMKIENLELDGNSDNIIYGGHYTDGIQLPHDGIFIDHSIGVIIYNANAHHFGREGLMITDYVCNPSPPPIGDFLDIRIGRSKFNWNGRNGFSLDGGHGIIVNNSEFNHNAVGRLASMPGVGVDVEWENGNSQNREVLTPAQILLLNLMDVDFITIKTPGSKMKAINPMKFLLFTLIRQLNQILLQD
ncbi:MAG: hypothetical protein IPP86_02510 [Bacteroidetes bacterium]|nr:hypothetical protein [Bacteroidota bacterium]